ncbi:MAG: CRISPR-associated endoribonuclease Cas6 [Waddliaceae bacterium]
MRLSIEYKFKSPFIPKDYRSGFVSLIKEALDRARPDLKRSYYDTYTLKPFTFATYFPLMKGNAGEHFHVGERVKINFSTAYIELATYLYNGFLKVRSFPFFDNVLYFERAMLRRQEVIRSEKVVFKTASPVLVSNIGSSDWFLLPGESGFVEGLNFAVSEISKKFLGKENATCSFEPIQIKRKVIWHYHQHRSSFTGVFQLNGQPEVLQLIYDVGLGVRRSQGFGMLEVVKQECEYVK